MIQEKKQKIRDAILKKLKRQKEAERLEKSFRIARKLFGLREFVQAKTILFYLSFDGEVDTAVMIDDTIRQGKRVAVPVMCKESRDIAASLLVDPQRDLAAGPYGIRHPKDECIRPITPHALDLVIVPGVAFDASGNRLGRGQGYYDRFLSRLPKDTPTIGLAFAFQMVSDFPPLEFHDLAVTKVLFA